MSGSDKDLYSGLIRLHVLHHAAERPIYGSWMIEELREHGYQISPGTLYPMLHGLARKGYREVRQEGPGKRARRLYSITRRVVPRWPTPRAKCEGYLENCSRAFQRRETT
jgi:hypothetical protein